MKPVIIAHRGASSLALHENSLEAFQIAIDLKAEYVEFDVRKTKDNRLVIFHNDSYEGRLISDLTYDELCSLTGSKGLLPPLLSQVLTLCKGQIKLDIELKEPGFEKTVIELVKKEYDYRDFMIKSFIDNVVKTIKNLDPNIKTGLLVGKSSLNLWKRLGELFPYRRIKQCNADFVSPHFRLATPFFIRRMNHHNVEMYVWTINKPALINKFLGKKITGIITDRPDIALSLRDKI